MNSKILHCFAGKRWSGDATSALNSALKSGGMVLTEAGEKAEARLRKAGVDDVRLLGMSGLFGALNLSRMLRIVRPAEVRVHSESLLHKVSQAVSLAQVDVKVVDMTSEIELPEVTPAQKGDKLLWIGYITKDCGLRALLEALETVPEVKLRIVGEGEAKFVGPLLNMAKSHRLKGRIEWVGEQENVYEWMNGCRAGVITCANPQSKVVYKEYFRAGLPVISGTLAEEIRNKVVTLL